MARNKIIAQLLIVATMVTLGCGLAMIAAACPFCSALNLTYAEQIKSNDIVVIATLLENPPPIGDPNAAMPRAEFEVAEVIKGQQYVSTQMKFRSILVGKAPIGQKFLVMGVDPPRIAWSTPIKASDRVIQYIQKLDELPKSGADRLAFFQDYFEDSESVLAFDAYDEFAKAPYEDLNALKDRMNRPQLIKWIRDRDVSDNRRRLYFTMLGVCGQPSDAEMLEEFIKSGDRKKQAGLDALIACYLNLKGEAGVDLIEKTFLQDENIDYVDTLAAVSALRFHGTELKIVSRDRIVGAIRHLLDRPKIADMIIPDLARWEDWSVMERLVQMFKDADEETNWLRVPVITYLRACPKPEARKYIEELSKIDPDAVRRADFFMDFTSETDDDSDDWGEESEEGDDVGDAEPSDADDHATANQNEQSDENTGSAAGSENDKSERKNQPENGASGDGDGELANRLSGDTEATLTSFGVADTASPIGTPPRIEDVEGKGGKVTVKRMPLEPADRSASMNHAAGSDVHEIGNKTISPLAQVDAGQPLPRAAVIVASSSPANLTWSIILVPMAVSAGIFVLLWSVINGWFSRLIY